MRNGQQYLNGIRDNRDIVYKGRRINVLEEAGFRNAAHLVSQYYDFQSDPRVLDLMSFESAPGQRHPISFRPAFSKEDLKARAAAYAAWSEVTCGFMGRSPDYMNTCVTTATAVLQSLDWITNEQKRNAMQLYEMARDGDLCFTHTFIEPFKAAATDGEQLAAHFSVRPNPAGGRLISGARGVATLAAFADWNFNLGFPPSISADGVPSSYTFAMPIAAPGVTWVCRDCFDTEPAAYDAPLSHRGDEGDCVAIFRDYALNPEHILAAATGPQVSAGRQLIVAASSALRHHTMIRFIAKARFMLGLAHLVAETSRVNRFPNVKEKLGEMVIMLQTMESLAIAAVEGAVKDPGTKMFVPHPPTVIAASSWCGIYSKRMVEILLDLGASRYVSTPHEASLDTLGSGIEEYFKSAGENGRQTVALHRLAWDVTGSSFGVRHDLYERFNFGDRTQVLGQTYLAYDKTMAIKMVKNLLRTPGVNGTRFPTPFAAAAPKTEEARR